MSYIFLLGQGEESLAGSFSDIPVYVLSRSNPTAERFYSSGNGMGSCPDSLSGMTCGPSTAIPGEDESTSSAEDSHARTSPSQAKGLGSAENAADYGLNLLGSLAKFDRDSYSWRTPQCSLVEGLDEFSGTWPRWGTMRNGVCWARMTLAHPIVAKGSGFWPTPVRADGERQSLTYGGGNKTLLGAGAFPTPMSSDWKGPNMSGSGSASARGLSTFVKKWPTPTCNDARNSTLPRATAEWDNIPGALIRAGEPIGGQLNPPWVEWLMNWPLNWSAIESLPMEEFNDWRRKTQGPEESPALNSAGNVRVWSTRNGSASPGPLQTARGDIAVPGVPSESRRGNAEGGRAEGCGDPLGLALDESVLPELWEDIYQGAPEADNMLPVLRESPGVEETWWCQEPEGIPRVATGVKHRMDRLRAIGNGQVPRVAAYAWSILMDRLSP